MQLLLEVGVEKIGAELIRKRKWLASALKDKGYTVLHDDVPDQNAGGMISFFRPGADLAGLHEKLNAARIVTSLRSDRAGQKYIRLSPHFYNTDAELQKTMEMV
jgi:selenocysteine lyase/cysteine desulfurase